MNKITIFLCLLFVGFVNLFYASNNKRDSLLKELETSPDNEQLDVLTELIYAFKNDSSKGGYYFNLAKKKAIKQNDYSELSEIYIHKSWIHKVKYQYDEVLKARRKAVEYAEMSTDKEQIGNAYKALSIAFKKNAKMDSSRIYSYKTLALYCELGDSLNIGKSYDRLGLLHYNLSNFDSAIIFINKAEHLIRKYGTKEDKTVVLYHKGLILQAKGRFFEAVNLYFELIEKFKQLRQTSNVWNTYDMLGNIFYRLKEYERSLELYKKAYRIKVKRGHKLAISYSLNNFARVYNELGLQDTALLLARKSLAVKLKLGSLNDIANSEEYLSRIFIKKGEYDSAIVYGNRAFRKYESADNYTGSALSALNIARAGKYRDDIESLSWIDSAVTRIKPEKDVFVASKVYKGAYEIFKAAGNKNKALNYLELYNQLKDKLHAGKKSYQLQYLLNKNELQEKIIEETGLKNKLQKEKTAKILALSVSGLVIVIFLLWFRILKLKRMKHEAQLEYETNVHEEQRKKEKELYEQNLQHFKELHEERKRKLVTAGAHLEKKNIALERIMEEVLKMSNGGKQNCHPESLISEIKKEINDQKDWNDFEHNFNEINPGKLSRLKALHPHLSDSDLRFCAYILINSDNTTLANVLGISTDSVRKKKTRLKKKMGLHVNCRLTNYLYDA